MFDEESLENQELDHTKEQEMTDGEYSVGDTNRKGFSILAIVEDGRYVIGRSPDFTGVCSAEEFEDFDL